MHASVYESVVGTTDDSGEAVQDEVSKKLTASG